MTRPSPGSFAGWSLRTLSQAMATLASVGSCACLPLAESGVSVLRASERLLIFSCSDGKSFWAESLCLPGSIAICLRTFRPWSFWERLLQFHQKRCRVLSNSHRECEAQQKKSERGPRGGERVVDHTAGFELSCRWMCSLFGVWILILHVSPYSCLLASVAQAVAKLLSGVRVCFIIALYAATSIHEG